MYGQKGQVSLMGRSQTDTRASTPYTGMSRPFTPADLPSLPQASSLASSPYDEDRKLRREVIQLRKRNKELEQQLADLNTTRQPINVERRQKQIDSAYGVIRPGGGGMMPPLEDGSGSPASPSELDQRLSVANREAQQKIDELRGEYERRVADGDREKSAAMSQLSGLKSQVGALSGSLEEAAARHAKREREAREKERQARVDLLYRNASRRLLNQRLMAGWGAWTEYWNAKAYALDKLRECANRLRKSEPAGAFYGWLRVLENEAIAKVVGEKALAAKSVQQQLEHWQLEASNTEHERKLLHDKVKGLHASLQQADAKLRAQAEVLADLDGHKARQERFYQGKLELLQVAHADDNKGLEERNRELTAQIKAKEEELMSLLANQTSEQLVEENRRCLAAAEAAEARCAEAESEAARQVTSNKSLLEKLLEAQRGKFEVALAGCTCQYAARREAALQAEFEKARQERLELMHKQSARRILNTGLTNCWSGWVEFWEAKSYAIGRLKEVANRLRSPELSHAYQHWLKRVHATVAARLRAEDKKKAEMLTEEGRRIHTLQEALEKVQKQLAEVTEERKALAQQVATLDGGLAMEALSKEEELAKAKEERIEIMRKQMVRRMMNAGLTGAWTKWLDGWRAKRHALQRLRECGNRMRAPEASDMFVWWSKDVLEKKRALEAKAAEERAKRAAEARVGLVQQMETMRAEYERRLAASEEERITLKAKVAQLDGGQSQMEALLEAQAQVEKERRVELMRRQSARRIMNGGLTRGFSAWLQCAQARRQALRMLQQTGARLRSPALAETWYLWAEGSALARSRREQQKLRSEMRKEAGLKGDAMSFSEKLQKQVATLERQLKEAELDKQQALKRQAVELTGSAEEVLKMRTQMEKEERVELLRRQSMRRILNAGLSNGWSAWHELYVARKYALKRLKEAAGRLKAPEGVADSFSLWAGIVLEMRQRKKLSEEKRRALGLEGEALTLSEQMKLKCAEYERQLAAAKVEREAALRQLRVELTGTADEVMAMRESRDKEQRVELLRRQIARRMLQSGLNRGWAAWLELWNAKVYAITRLRECGSRIKAPELADTFGFWAVDVHEERHRGEMRALRRREKTLESGKSAQMLEMEKLKVEHERQLVRLEEEKQKALRHQLVTLTGSADEVMAMQTEQEKEHRVEMLRRQSMRRMANSGLSFGFVAWTELANARRYALTRLRDMGNKLRSPEKSTAFEWWTIDLKEAKRLAEIARLEKESKSLEAQLRRARHEAHQIGLVKVAQEDELKALRDKLAEMGGAMGDGASVKAKFDQVQRAFEEERERHREASEAAKEAERLRLESEEDAERQRTESQKLLERLLAEQRRKLEGTGARIADDLVTSERVQKERLQAEVKKQAEEVRTLKAELTSMRAAGVSKQRELASQCDKLKLEVEEAQRQLDTETSRLRRELTAAETQRKAAAADAKAAQAEAKAAGVEADKARKEAEKADEKARKAADEVEEQKRKAAAALKTSPMPAPPKKAVKIPRSLGNLDLDEGPDALPISVQLGNALRKNAGKVLDLFRDWDADGDGEVSRKEFHEAMAALGLEVPEAEIDKLFSEWDSDGGGALEFGELKKILSRPAVTEVKSAAAVAGFAAKMKGFGTKAKAPPA